MRKVLVAKLGAAGVVLWIVAWGLWELFKDAIFGWLNSLLVERWGVIETTIQQAFPTLTTIVPPVILGLVAIGTVWSAYRLGRKTSPEDTTNKINQRDYELKGIRIDHVEHVHIHQDGATKTATLQIKEAPPAHPKTAHINFVPAQMYGTGEPSFIHSSSNISSIIDSGEGDFTFTFSEPLDKETLVAHPIGSTPRFRVVTVSNHSVNVKFDDGEPDEIGIRFDSRDSEALADFLFSADELIKRIVSSNDDLNKWKQDYQEWNTNVTNFIRNNISHIQAYYFSNPGMVVVRQFDGVYNDEHNSLLNSLAVRRENLRHLHSLES